MAPASTPRWAAPWRVAQSRSCLARKPSSPLPATDEKTPRRPRSSLWEYSSHRISSIMSIRALQSVPRLTAPAVASRLAKTPSPRAASVSGHTQTPPPAATSRASSSGLEWVQCTAHSRRRLSAGTLSSSSARGVTPCAATQSLISCGCSSRCTCSGIPRRAASAASDCSMGVPTARSECTTTPRPSPRDLSRLASSRSICCQYRSPSMVRKRRCPSLSARPSKPPRS
mmetsp:Transcript_17589/g.57691  ORF Transcript_17589/g.57691 Transcript_17589/m.57691 type:complete len:228 (-) Transcript_17589:1131-1814(-)